MRLPLMTLRQSESFKRFQFVLELSVIKIKEYLEVGPTPTPSQKLWQSKLCRQEAEICQLESSDLLSVNLN